MNDHHPRPERAGGRYGAGRGRPLFGLVMLAASAAALPTELALPVAAPRVAVLAQAAGAAQPEGTAEAVARVEIANEQYLPIVLVVPAGTTVTWTSRDDDPHTVTSTENVFASPGLEAEESFSYTFATPGTYAYFCKLHPHMTGTIIVQ